MSVWRVAPESVPQSWWSESVTPCYYCGLPADSTDHVIPRAVIEQIETLGDPDVLAEMYTRHRVRTVDACRECNSMLQSRYFSTLAERKAWMKDRLRTRYRRYLELPEWADTELMELSERLQMRVIASLEIKRIIQRRLAA